MNIITVIGNPESGKTEYVKNLVKGKKVYSTNNIDSYNEISEIVTNGIEADYFIYEDCNEVEADMIDFLNFLQKVESDTQLPEIVFVLDNFKTDEYYKELINLSNALILKKMSRENFEKLSTIIKNDNLQYDLSLTELLSVNENYKLTREEFKLEK